jgi:hypothetical protein
MGRILRDKSGDDRGPLKLLESARVDSVELESVNIEQLD